MENPIKMDDLGVPLFLETPIGIYWVYQYPLLKGSNRGVKQLGTLHLKGFPTILAPMKPRVCQLLGP